MTGILVSWVGNTDLEAAADDGKDGIGPIAQAVTGRAFDRVVLLSNYGKQMTAPFLKWIESQSDAQFELRLAELTSPIHFGEIYTFVTEQVADVLSRYGDGTRLTYHLSPGTPAMQAVWIIVAKTRYAATLIQSSRESGLQTASIPFDISAEFLPEMQRRPDERIERLTAGLPEAAPEFASILHKCTAMKECIARARAAAGRDVPVLLEGESGTGKELFARAIHEASPRRNGQLIAVNCGAIAQDLIESELFGHEKGAFTGASNKRAGHFETAKGGTIFLDEVGELPLSQQVKLLRVLQEKQITRVGSSSPVDVDVRIIAATHRNLPKAVTDGEFREDLFYRLAVAIIALPPLRQRPGDLNMLIDHLLADINDKCSDQPSWQDQETFCFGKKCSS